MTDNYQKIMQEKDIPENYKYYWGYQYNLGKDILVPYLASKKAFNAGFSVAEIGSAEGGVLAAFAEKGSVSNLATDIAENRLDIGDVIARSLNLPIHFEFHNIIDQAPKPEWVNKFDLVLLRDVIEHLDDTGIALKNINKIIKKGGFLFVTFPPYHSPFGGHQHTVMNKPGKLPYIHLLPKNIFHLFLKGGRENDIGEVMRLENIRLTPGKFRNAAERNGFEIFYEDFYILRPVFKMKFGLPAFKLTALKRLPLVKSFFSMEASYILRKTSD